MSDPRKVLRDLLGSQTVNVNVQAGGAAVWVAALAAVFCAGAAHDAKRETATLRIEAMTREARLEQRLETMQAHLSAIYMQAPHLRPREEGND